MATTNSPTQQYPVNQVFNYTYDSGTDSWLPQANGGTVFNGTTFDRLRKPNLTARIISSAASTNPTLVKNAPGDLFILDGFNSSASPRWLKLYNKASAPTVGTDTPIWTEYLAPQSKFTVTGFGGQPLYFSVGIAFALTTGSPDADTGALTAADVQGLNVAYA